MAKLSAVLESPDYPANSRLPAERALSVQLGLSRSALREALEILEAQGKVWRHVGQGTFIGTRPAPEPAALTRLLQQSVDRTMGGAGARVLLVNIIYQRSQQR